MASEDVICDVIVTMYGKDAHHKFNIDEEVGMRKFVSAVREFTKHMFDFRVVCVEEY